MKRTRVLSARVPCALLERVDATVKARGIDRQTFVVAAVTKELEAQEDIRSQDGSPTTASVHGYEREN